MTFFLERIIFYVLIFAIPFERRLIVAKWVYPFNEWASAYLYATDILIFLLFVFWLVRYLKARTVKEGKSVLLSPKNPDFWLVIFFVVSGLSIFSSHIKNLSFYQLLKLAEFIGLYFYLRAGLGKIFSFHLTLAAIVISGFFQALVGIVQYAKQISIGLKFLGESPLAVNASGVAVFVAGSQKYLRAYGTTPHPNVLAAWLFIVVFALYFWYLYYAKTKLQQIILMSAYPILLFGLFFTFSRVIIGLWLIGVIVRILISFLRKDLAGFVVKIKGRIMTVSLVSIISILVFAFLFWPQIKSRIHVSAEEEAVTQRVFYSRVAGSVVTSHPWLGVGIGQFVPQMISKLRHLPANLYQPVHNIYLLIASETGLVGVASFLLFLLLVFVNFTRRADFKKLYNSSFLILSLSFLVIGFFDHFLWTLQQGSLIFWMVLALMASSVNLQSQP